MSGFRLCTQSAAGEQVVEQVASFVGADASGAFGLMPGHERLVTVLEPGLCRYRLAEGPWQYLATSGGVLDFSDNCLKIAVRHFVAGADYQQVAADISAILEAEKETLHSLKHSIIRLEQELVRQIWGFQRQQGAGHV